MFNRKEIVTAIAGIVFTFTFTVVSASKFENSVEGQPIVLAQSSIQHKQHENFIRMNRSTGSMMAHMSGRSGHRGHSYAHMISTHADELKLSDAQLGRIVRLHLKHAQEHKQFKRTIHKSMLNFHHASMKPGTNDDDLRKLGNEHVNAFKAMIEQHIRSRNVVHAILTPEQREQLKTMKMNHSIHGKGHGGYRGHGRYGGKHSQRFY